VAGDEAARLPSRWRRQFGSLLKQAQAVEAARHGLKTKTGGTERIATLRKEMAQTMEDGCGIYRLADTMQKTCDKLDELRERFKNVNIEDKSSVWNTEWLLAIELGIPARRGADDGVFGHQPQGIARRPPASGRFRGSATTSTSSSTRKPTTSRRRTAHRLRRCQDHQVQPGTRAYGGWRAADKEGKAAQERKASHVCKPRKVIPIEPSRFCATDPEQDKKSPSCRTFKVPFTDDMSVLQGVQYIKDYLDGSLSYRWSCRMAICGSCGMMINGKPSLSCQTFPARLLPGPDHHRAAGSHFPIERDLVIVMDGFIEKLESIQPYIIPAEPRTLAEGEYLQTPAQRDVYEQFSSCINCMLCYAACPQFGLDPKFIGPGIMALLHRYNVDSRDGGAEPRNELVRSEEGVFNCTAVGYCSEVCPKKVDPANAVNEQSSIQAPPLRAAHGRVVEKEPVFCRVHGA
jgi:fumarate reductase iron-sulfur subunit